MERAPNSDSAGGDTFGAALLRALDDDALDALAMRLRPRLVLREEPARVPADGYMDAAGAARFLGCSRRRIYDLKSMGILPPDGFDGRKPLWRRSTLVRYVE